MKWKSCLWPVQMKEMREGMWAGDGRFRMFVSVSCVCVSFGCFGYDDSFIDKRSSRQSCSGSF